MSRRRRYFASARRRRQIENLLWWVPVVLIPVGLVLIVIALEMLT